MVTAHVACEGNLERQRCFKLTPPDNLILNPTQTPANLLKLELQQGKADLDLANQPDAKSLVLLVEDDQANIATFFAYLTAKGYRLLIATDGEEAVVLAKEYQPDVILMDIQLPKIDGLEAIRLIRNIPELENTPIIALTALAMSGDRERCLEAGANKYLSKPMSLKHLVEIVQQFCGQQKGK